MIGVATVVAATAVTAVMTVGTKISAGGKAKGGNGGGNVGLGGSAVFTGFAPSGSLRSLGGTTNGT